MNIGLLFSSHDTTIFAVRWMPKCGKKGNRMYYRIVNS